MKKKEGGIQISPRGCVVLANHINWFDPWMISTKLPIGMQISWLAKEELFDWNKMYEKYKSSLSNHSLALLRKPIAFVLAWLTVFFVRSSGAIPVDRDNERNPINRQMLIRVKEILRQGGAFGIFPEGGTGRYADHARFHDWFIPVAVRAGAVILPIKVTPDGITIFAPITYSDDPSQTRAERTRIKDDLIRILFS